MTPLLRPQVITEEEGELEVTWSWTSSGAGWGDSVIGGIVIPVTQEESKFVRQQLQYGDDRVSDQGQI